MYQLRGTLFDCLDLFGIHYTDNQKLFENLAIFDFESLCMRDDKFCDTDTTTLIGKHVPISELISSNLLEEQILACNSNPRDLVESFVYALDGLAQSKAQMKLKFFKIETNV